MVEYGMVIDLERCVGCHACSVACKAENDVPLGVWRSWVKYLEKGTFPNVKKHFLPRLCNHCHDAPCVKVCPVQATYKDKNGIVSQRFDRCIGCKYCIMACPYSARYILPRTTAGSRWKNVADKCNFCKHRVEKGQLPACVVTCQGRARTFGDITDPNSEISKVLGTKPTVVLKAEQGTKPNVYYVKPEQSIMGGRTRGHNVYAPEVPEEHVSTTIKKGGH